MANKEKFSASLVISLRESNVFRTMCFKSAWQNHDRNNFVNLSMAKSEWFVKPGSIVREIWGKSDTILFIFAGSSAEFALNRAVDWLYFTGRLPADPLNRLFSTVEYARLIVFSEKDRAHGVIDQMRSIHAAVEDAKKATIPDWEIGR